MGFVDLIAGARPNFMKIAPIIRAIQARDGDGAPIRYRLVHTGQHYDARMSSDVSVSSAFREWKRGGIPELWDGRAATRIIDHLSRILSD